MVITVHCTGPNIMRGEEREGGQFVLTECNDGDITAGCLLANLNLSDIG